MKKFSKPNFYSIKSQLTVWIALQILIPVFPKNKNIFFEKNKH